MKVLLFLSSILILSACGTTPMQKIPTKGMEGKIVKVNFVNKAGREIEGVFDYYFDMKGGEKYFIKISESKVTQRELLQYLNQPIEISGEIRDGNWDSDDPNVQSRIGKYIIIKAIYK